jgi:hypothetical protein
VNHLIPLFLLFLLFISAAKVPAQDRIFNYTYQSIVLGPQQSEIEVWNTLRWGKENYYQALDQRIEFETGLIPNLQTAFYLNVRSTSAAVLAEGTGSGLAGLESETELSFSNEWKYKLFDPVADPIGLAVYAEYAVGSRGFELEPRIILDKITGATVLALNVSAELEFEKEIEEDGTESTERATEIHLTGAIGFRLAPGFHLGLEVFSKNGLSDGSLSYSALYAGPTLSYAVERFWVNVTFMPQLTGLSGATNNGLVLDEAERYQTRLLFSFAI